MRCLSLHQPWATLVVSGEKVYETRGWKTEHRGLLVIHASKKFSEVVRDLCQQEPFRSSLKKAGYSSVSDLPLGKLIGVVQLEDCLPVETIALPTDAKERHYGDYRAGRWAWKLSHPTPLVVPIPYPGHLGLFDVPDTLLEPFWEPS